MTHTDIAQYCHVLGLDDAVYLDPGAARCQPSDVVATGLPRGHPARDAERAAAGRPGSGRRQLRPHPQLGDPADGRRDHHRLPVRHPPGTEITLTRDPDRGDRKAGRFSPLGLVTYQLDYRTAAGELTVPRDLRRILR
ncbi:hypothetical protein HBB16_08170 [Pseudonocardia sp. MCCB 268]|nr:hypothetical protein [Pseudonocardia cytotoxica]